MKTYIWGVPTRLFHWLLAIGFTTAYILGDIEDYPNLHFAFGAFVGVLLILRLLYGLIGPRYSHFRDFPIGLRNQVEFIKTYFSGTYKYAGHNPPASVVMLLIIIAGILSSLTGYLQYASENGLFAFSGNSEFFEEAHEVMPNILLALVIIHLAGVISDLIFHLKTGTVTSIFTGYKNIDAENARLNGLQKVFAVLWILIPFFFFYYAYQLPVTNKENNKHGDYKTEKHDNEENEDD